jgi:hypothetical protein
MSEEEIIPSESFENIPIEDEIEIGSILNDIERILHCEASTTDNDFKPRAKEMLDKLQGTSDWLYVLRQIERTQISELQGSILGRVKAIFKGESIESQIKKLDQKVMANQELTNLYNEIILHLDDLLEKHQRK